MTAFFSESRPSAGVYFTSPVWSREEQLTMASMGALFLGSPPPRRITGSPLSRTMEAVRRRVFHLTGLEQGRAAHDGVDGRLVLGLASAQVDNWFALLPQHGGGLVQLESGRLGYGPC